MNFSRIESYSSLKTFSLCPLKYKNKYILKIEEEQGEAAKRGSDFHGEIEKFSKNEIKLEDLSEQALFAEKFIHEHSKKKYFNLNEKNEKVLQYIEFQIGMKYRGEDEFVFCNYDDKECVIRGKVDYVAIFFEKGTKLKINKIEIVDWKTGTSSGDRKQLKFYAVLLKNYFDVKFDKITMRFVYLDKKKASDFLLYEEDENEILEWIEEIKESIKKEENFYPKKNWACKWCSFKDCIEHPDNLSKKELKNGLDFLLNLRGSNG